MSLCCFLFNY